MLREKLKGFAIGVVATLALTMAVSAFANSTTSNIQVTFRSIGVNVDGRTIVTENEPFIFEGRTYLAARDIAEAFDAEIRMNELTNVVEITSRQAVNTLNQTAPANHPSDNTAMGTNPQTSPDPTVSPRPTSSPGSGSSDRGQRPANPPITREMAIEIAERDLLERGLSAEFRSASISWERNQWVWEVEFRSGRTEYEWYINVDTGEIVKFERDR